MATASIFSLRSLLRIQVPPRSPPDPTAALGRCPRDAAGVRDPEPGFVRLGLPNLSYGTQ